LGRLKTIKYIKEEAGADFETRENGHKKNVKLLEKLAESKHSKVLHDILQYFKTIKSL
jgi:hypothetical protein